MINIINKKLYAKKIKSYQTVFDKKIQNVAKYQNLTFSDLEKLPLERFNQIHLLAVHQYPHGEASCLRAKVIIYQSVLCQEIRS